ncbi:MAG: hypothetical protein V1821_03575 [bacterium]
MESKNARALGGLVAVLAFVAFSLFPIFSPPVFNSPDENSNATFARRLAQTGTFSFPDYYSFKTPRAVAPRGTLSSKNQILPGSFLGLPVIYSAFTFLTPKLLVLVTPLLAALAGLIWFKYWEKKRGWRFALLAETFFLFHPALWYYASRGLHPNGLFLALAMFGLVALLESRERSRVSVWSFWSGVLVGAAVFARASEALWLLPIFLVIAAWIPKFRFRRLWYFGLGLIPLILLMLILNWKVFGSPLATGYGQLGEVLKSTEANMGAALVSPFSPFGLDIAAARHMAWHQGVLIFPLASLVAFFGLLLALGKKYRSEFWPWILAFVVLGVYLVLAYGSAHFKSNTSAEVSIGASFVRYWLPLYVFGSVFSALLIEHLLSLAKSRKIKIGVASLALTSFLVFSAVGVYWQFEDSLAPTVSSLKRYALIKRQVLEIVPQDAILIADSADKIFFPERMVMSELRAPGTYEAVRELIPKTELYYFGVTLPPVDRDFIQTEKLPGFQVIPLKTFDYETLYQFRKL